MTFTTTAKQDKEFIGFVIPSNLLEETLDWISSNMNPEDVFSEIQLLSWAEDNGIKKASDHE